jgi:ubiquinone/menaquinone biosynthesis C-methylase UbiE
MQRRAAVFSCTGGRRQAVGFYAEVIFPRICDCIMNNANMAKHRKDLLAKVSGEILEIGFGTGLNLPNYPDHVRKITAIDPSSGMNRIARKRIAQSPINVDVRMLSGEELPLGDLTFDCVVSTWTLCSIPGVERALGEVYRVLKPGGRFIYLEHGQSDDPKVQRWQRRLNPIQRRFAVGCRLDLDVVGVIKEQPFQHVEWERFLMEQTPRIVGTMYRGVATK